MSEKIIDIHTHVLPAMDDGCSTVEESLQLLSELSRQGVTAVAATPHFYADRENPSSFLTRRQKTLSALTEKLDFDLTLLPGAEVCYYQGVSRTEELPEFAIGSSELVLLEMPFYDWTPSVINEVFSIQRDRKLNVVIAHIDRYLSRKNMAHIESLLDFGVLFQINATAFLDKKKRSAALDLLKKKTVHFIASDCHNMTSRPPKLRDAYDVIEKKLGYKYLEWLSDCEKYITKRGIAD
ncbi:MAG: capsular polysaccharide biosynthesis protein [Eubacteriales bacterium]|nr:capsular polysaccharide biosynthesis protein [Eubacteriales bacterium]